MDCSNTPDYFAISSLCNSYLHSDKHIALPFLDLRLLMDYFADIVAYRSVACLGQGLME